MNWRDIKSPLAGGAEIFTFENAKRWIKAGHEVAWFASSFEGAKEEEIIEGIRIIRRGTEFTVHYQAFRHYQKLIKGKFDLVIDQINTVPFFTPLYVKEQKIVLIHQLSKNVWFYEIFFPLSLIGYIAEYFYLKIYRNTPILTVSESTKKDLLDLGFEKNIFIVPEGISFLPLPNVSEKEKDPTLIFVGRLRRSKRADHVVHALRILRERIPNLKLRIVGSRGRPRYKIKLDNLIRKFNLENHIIYHGFADEETKRRLIRTSHAVIVPSVREGWCLVVTEANALSTPAIGYNIPGLRDSIRDGETGLLTQKNNPQSLADAIYNLVTNEPLRMKLSKNALEWSREFSWDKSAEKISEAFKKIIPELTLYGNKT